jgi:hypothetical protein
VVLASSLLATVGLCRLLARGRLAAALLGVKPRRGSRATPSPRPAAA